MQQAWDISRDVARELSDKEARKQYYDTKGLLDDVNKVHQYFVGPFSQYFAQMVKSVHDHTRGIAAQLETLNNAGLDLKKEAHIFEAEDEELERKKADAQENRKKELERRKQKKAETAQQDSGMLEGTITTVKNFFGSLVDSITNLITSLKSFFDGIISTVKGWFFSAEEKVTDHPSSSAKRKGPVKEVQQVKKDSQGEAYKAGKAIHEAVEDAAEYVEGKAEDVVEYAQDKVHAGAEYIENKARVLKEKLDDAQEGEHDLLDDL